MPIVYDVDTDERMELGDLVEALETEPNDLNDEECLASYAPQLRKLGNTGAFSAISSSKS